MSSQNDPESKVREIRRKTRRKFSAEEKIRIVLEGLRGEDSIAELCRRDGINSNLNYRWSNDFPEAGKRRLAGEASRHHRSDAGRPAGDERHLVIKSHVRSSSPLTIRGGHGRPPAVILFTGSG